MMIALWLSVTSGVLTGRLPIFFCMTRSMELSRASRNCGPSSCRAARNATDSISTTLRATMSSRSRWMRLIAISRRSLSASISSSIFSSRLGVVVTARMEAAFESRNDSGAWRLESLRPPLFARRRGNHSTAPSQISPLFRQITSRICQSVSPLHREIGTGADACLGQIVTGKCVLQC